MATFDNITPIFVIGTERAGTKWLTSIFRKHPDIAAPESPKGGVFEANFVSFNYHFPDLRRVDDYIAMVELFSLTGIFSALGIDKEYLYDLKDRPENYYQLFGVAMTEYARRNNSRYWIQKASPISFEEIRRNFPNARFIIVTRSLIDNIRSKVALNIRAGIQPKPYRKTLQYVYQKKLCKKYGGDQNTVAVIKYHALKLEQAVILPEVLSRLGLGFQGDMLIAAAEDQGHSSFRRPQQRSKVLSRWQIGAIKIINFLMGMVPLPLIKMAFRLRYLNLAQSQGYAIRGIFYPQAERYKLKYESKELGV